MCDIRLFLKYFIYSDAIPKDSVALNIFSFKDLETNIMSPSGETTPG